MSDELKSQLRLYKIKFEKGTNEMKEMRKEIEYNSYCEECKKAAKEILGI